MLVDTHCHIDLFPDYRGVLARITQGRVATLAMTNAPSVYRKCVELTATNPFVRVAVGLHPQLAAERASELPLLISLIGETPYVGEVGLDFSEADHEVRKTQRRVFEKVLDACRAAGNRVLSVHSRRAAVEVVAMIGSGFPSRVILHWFSGGLSVTEQAVRLGFFFSVNPAMVTSARGCSIIATVPRDRVLTESDGPFVSMGARPAEPGDVHAVISHLARAWSAEESDVRRQISENLRSLRGGSPGDAWPPPD